MSCSPRLCRGRPSLARLEGGQAAPQRPPAGEGGQSGYTAEEAERLAGYRARILELTTLVLTHPYWQTLSGPDRVEERTALKHAHDPAGPKA
ncbi:hypothetical protein [Streptomyces sp. NPDC058411]|uniref:hypothetical protein n=1 Tax=Streptomyces sp. NPDC058411 TaxID=3346485 RepID=UPI003648D501